MEHNGLNVKLFPQIQKKTEINSALGSYKNTIDYAKINENSEEIAFKRVLQT